MVCEDDARAPDEFVEDGRVTSPQLDSLVVDALFKYEIRNGVPHRRFQKTTQVFTDKPPSEDFARARQALERMVTRYFRRIAKIGEVELVKERRLADPRTLYIQDLEPDYGYTTLGFKILGLRYRKVTRIWKRKYKTRRLIVDVSLTLEQLERGLPEKIWKRLRFEKPKKGHAYPARISNFDYAIAEPLSELLGDYLRRGFYDSTLRPKDWK
jgi:hypothetical protein